MLILAFLSVCWTTSAFSGCLLMVLHDTYVIPKMPKDCKDPWRGYANIPIKQQAKSHDCVYLEYNCWRKFDNKSRARCMNHWIAIWPLKTVQGSLSTLPSTKVAYLTQGRYNMKAVRERERVCVKSEREREQGGHLSFVRKLWWRNMTPFLNEKS